MVTIAQGNAIIPVMGNLNMATNNVTAINQISAASSQIESIGITYINSTGTSVVSFADLLTASESVRIWNDLFTIYNNRVTAASTQLTAI